MIHHPAVGGKHKIRTGKTFHRGSRINTGIKPENRKTVHTEILEFKALSTADHKSGMSAHTNDFFTTHNDDQAGVRNIDLHFAGRRPPEFDCAGEFEHVRDFKGN